MQNSNKFVKFLSSKKVGIILSFLGLYLLSAGASTALFSYLKGEPNIPGLSGDVGKGRSKIDANLPKTEECPINGKLYSKPERTIWETRRPITAMIENHADSRPPSGISKADVVYEAVAEGGITRFLSVFYCGAAAEDVKVAPVRSVRIYFIDWASEYGGQPIFMHVGGANDFAGYGDTARDVRALELLTTIGWRVPKGNDFDTTYDSGYPIFWRNYERLDHTVATEHTMMASLDAAYAEADKRGFGAENKSGKKWDEDFIKWSFVDGKPSGSPAASEISFKFWDNQPDYDVSWKYSSSDNTYLRSNGATAHIDLETKKQIAASNVVIQFVKERGPVDRNKHMFYTTTGEGKAVILQNGEKLDATWKKATRTDRTRYYLSGGKEASFVRGTIWIEAVPLNNKVDYR